MDAVLDISSGAHLSGIKIYAYTKNNKFKDYREVYYAM
jgi:hypothetical protein